MRDIIASSDHWTSAPEGQTLHQDNHTIWHNLKVAIAKSSGFQRWQENRPSHQSRELEQQVRSYLKETLETLAY